MKKAELENYVANMAVFISAMHSMANLPLPDDFNPEEQALVVKNALTHRAEKDYATRLLMADNTKEELEDLTNRMARVDWLALSDHTEKQLESIPFGELSAQADTTPHLVSENSTDQTLKSE